MDVIAVGIDVSKGTSTVCGMRPLRKIIFKPRDVRHTASELGSLADYLKTLDGEVRVIMEATGRYHEPVAETLHAAGIFVSVVNPKLTHDYGNNTLRKVHNDRADARKIARYGLDNWAELREYSREDATRLKLKEFSRQFNLYDKTKVALKNNLIALLDQTFPGVRHLFTSPPKSDGRIKWVDFVTTFWHCELITRLDEPAFTACYRDWCKRNKYRFSIAKAAKIYAANQDIFTTLSINADAELLITEAAKQLTAVSRSVEMFRSQILRLAAMLPEYPAVMALYGAGDTTGPQLMAEIGDIRRFSSRKNLVAFAGVDPGDNQSGTYQAKSVKTSKRGSSQLRKALFQTVSTYLKQKPADEPVYQFLDRKRAEGKKYYVYMTAAANKFLRIYYARVKAYLDGLEDSGC